MKFDERTIQLLNDLIQINNDRIIGYEKAEADSKEEDLRVLFRGMATESRQFVLQLAQLVTQQGEEPGTGTTMKGRVYRGWMEMKTSITGKDRKTILASCEFGENAAQNAYADALEAELPEPVRKLLLDQKQKLRISFDLVKALKAAQPA